MNLRFVILTVAVVAALTGCSLFGAPSDPLDGLRAYVTREVTEPDRKRLMLSAVDAFDSSIESYNDLSARAGAELQELNRDYDTTRPQFDELLQRHNAQHTEARNDIVANAMQLRELATPTEWAEIAEFETRAYRERLVVLASAPQEKKS